MRIILALWPLLLAAALLLSGNGMQVTALGLRGLAEGFSPTALGLLVSAYSIGFIVGCRFAPGFIASVGHIRAFAAFASIASVAALTHAMIVDHGLWLVLRMVSGFCFAAIHMIMESWLNETATNENRGKVLSLYRITDFTTVTVAQGLLALFDPTQFFVFGAISVAFSLALVPVALTRVQTPPPPVTASLNLKLLWQVSPLAVAGACGVGLTSSAFWAYGPVLVAEAGYANAVAGYLMGAIIFGGALAQWPAGWLSDRTDRRKVLIGCASGATVAALFIPFAANHSASALIGNAFLFGIFALPSFGLAIAHANDHAAPGTAVSTNGSLLMIHGTAAVIGPLGASATMALAGPSSLFYWVAMVYGALVVFSLFRMTRRRAPEVREPYVPVPRTTPAVFELDPRATGANAESEADAGPNAAPNADSAPASPQSQPS